MTIEYYGVGKRLEEAARLCRSLCCGRIILLPIPTSKDGKYIKDTDIPLDETLKEANRDTRIVGYALPDAYKEKCEQIGAKVLDLSLDERFVLENARLTALATVGYLLSSFESDPTQLKIGVTGYGRIGKAIVRILLFLGAHPTVYTTRPELAEALAECGISSVCGYPCSFSGLDVLINTAPRDMRDSIKDAAMRPGRILEVASGKNFEGIEGVEFLNALPEKIYPISAAVAYFEAVKRWLL